MEKVKVGIVGHSGRLGSPLGQILTCHPNAEIVYSESRSLGAKGSPTKVEVVFLALPPGEGREYVKRFSNKKIIDLSMDNRHNHHWTYGLSEVFGAEISNAKKIANPGCYATSILLGLFPLTGKIQQVSISSTSGISGAGMEAAKEDNFLVYKEGRKHSQIREIEQILKVENFFFVPQRIDTADRGIISTMFIKTCEVIRDATEFYVETYAGSPFVRIKKEIATKNVIGTNFCDIKIMQFGKDVVIISALDNLVKGGAGQAVQNFNLMCGFPETTGLI